jgi:hypothetical protein
VVWEGPARAEEYADPSLQSAAIQISETVYQ